MINGSPKTIYISPLEKGDHPGLDASNFFDASRIKYQSLIESI